MTKNNKNGYFILFFILYILILFLMATLESGVDGANITSVGDAFWYSIATLTTVGYGDYYPVTIPGRMLGLIFMVMSVGFFGFMLSVFVSKFSGQIAPRFVMNVTRKKNWYIFVNVGENSLFLADSIMESDKDAIVIFCGKRTKEALDHPSGNAAVFAEMSLEDVLKRRPKNCRCRVLSMGNEGYVNYQKALQCNNVGIEIYCESPMHMDNNPANVHIFNKYSCLARYVWAEYPLLDTEAKTVIIGCDKYGSELIEQALLVNVDSILGNREYHIFGNVKEFQSLHTELATCFGINYDAKDKDDLYFYEDSPLDHKNILSDAGRIIICMDDDEDNLRLYNEICRYVSTSGKIFVREKSGIRLSTNNVVFIGSNKETLSYEVIIKDKHTAKAKEMHDNYCKNNPDRCVKWEELSDFTRRSNIAVADHIATKTRILLEDEITSIDDERLKRARDVYEKTKVSKADMYRRIEHERWMRFHILDNWKYAKDRDDSRRLHNMIIEYDKLSEEEKAKDDYGWEIL